MKKAIYIYDAVVNISQGLVEMITTEIKKYEPEYELIGMGNNTFFLGVDWRECEDLLLVFTDEDEHRRLSPGLEKHELLDGIPVKTILIKTMDIEKEIEKAFTQEISLEQEA